MYRPTADGKDINKENSRDLFCVYQFVSYLYF